MSEAIKVKLSNFDRFLNIHQTYSLEKLNRTSAIILNEQFKQNAQLNELNKHFSHANEMTKRILNNQISELKHKEEQKFYKNLSFSMGELIDSISSIANTELRLYFIKNYKNKIKANISGAIEKLDEISDKLYNKKLNEQLDALVQDFEMNSSVFNQSPLSLIDSLLDDYRDLELEIKNLRSYDYKQYKNEIKKPNVFLGVVLGLLTAFALLFFIAAVSMRPFQIAGLIISIVFLAAPGIPFYLYLKKNKQWNKGELMGKEKAKLNRQEAVVEVTNKLEQLKTHEALKSTEAINLKYPDFENICSKVILLDITYPITDEVLAEVKTSNNSSPASLIASEIVKGFKGALSAKN